MKFITFNYINKNEDAFRVKSRINIKEFLNKTKEFIKFLAIESSIVFLDLLL